MATRWYVILNPISGNGRSGKKKDQIESLLKSENIPYTLQITKARKHEFSLVQDAVKKGFRKFICVGGDGTLHNMVNAVMTQTTTGHINITIGVIPVGTGNDWVKTYRIPLDLKKAVHKIKEEKTMYQDIGKLSFKDQNKVFYFNNVAGIGYDSLVVQNLKRFKSFGALSYLLSGIFSYQSYKNVDVSIHFSNKDISTPLFLFAFGIGRYSGGGLRLTDHNTHKKGFFDISLIREIGLISILKNILNLYNGKIGKVKEVETYKSPFIEVSANSGSFYVQADGELLGEEKNIKIDLVKNAVQFVI